jgi:hypothetical protein
MHGVTHGSAIAAAEGTSSTAERSGESVTGYGDRGQRIGIATQGIEGYGAFGKRG